VTKFLVDGMLGKLARWLRAMGVDAAYDAAAPDEELVRRAVDEDRFLLTRDRRLTERRRLRGRVLLIAAERWPDQMRELSRVFDLTAGQSPLSRCLECNASLEQVPAVEVAGRVPPYIAWKHRNFLRCPDCGRIFWPGTHRDRMQATLAHLARQLRNSPDAEAGPENAGQQADTGDSPSDAPPRGDTGG
jgi:uncharacterized protein with PIN domain